MSDETGNLAAPDTPVGPCFVCQDEGWCIHRKATFYGPPEDFATIASRRHAHERARERMAKLPRYYRPTVHKPTAGSDGIRG